MYLQYVNSPFPLGYWNVRVENSVLNSILSLKMAQLLPELIWITLFTMFKSHKYKLIVELVKIL